MRKPKKAHKDEKTAKTRGETAKHAEAMGHPAPKSGAEHTIRGHSPMGKTPPTPALKGRKKGRQAKHY